MGSHRLGNLKWIFGIGWVFVLGSVESVPCLGQGSAAPPATKSTKPPAASDKNGRNPARKPTETERLAERARALFADAANAQNNGAYELALRQWNTMITEFPNHALSSSARYFLGVCYQEKEQPEYGKAIEAFRAALKDPGLKEREEALVHLGWALYQTGVSTEPPDSSMLGECAKVFATFLEKYPDSPFADRAMFYAGEAEARLGRNDKAIAFYNQLVQSRSLSKSPLRPDAMFSLGLSYEEAAQRRLAMETYEEFLSAYPQHPFVVSATVRLGELSLQGDRAKRAVELLGPIVDRPELSKLGIADYTLSRYALALAKAGQTRESSDAYQRLAERFPDSPYSVNAALAIGRSLMRDKNYDEASRAFEKLLAAKDEQAVEAAHWLCQIAILQNRPADAIPMARQALEWASRRDPQTVNPATAAMVTRLRMDLADGLFATVEGKVEARKLYEQIALESLDSSLGPRATYNASFAALQAGDHAEAQRWSEAFAKRFPTDELALDVAYVRAESLLQLSQFESAATSFEQLVRSAGSHPSVNAWELRGATAKYGAGDDEGVLSVIETILRRSLEPVQRAEAFYLKGASLLRLDKPSDAVAALEESLRAQATWSQADEALLRLSQAYEAAKDVENAKRTLERLLKEFPNSRFRQQAEFRLGQLSAAAKEYAAALTWYDRVLDTPVDALLADYARHEKAFALIQLERFGQAIDVLDRIQVGKQPFPLRSESMLAKAICLRRTNRAAEALPILENLLATELTRSANANVRYELGLAYRDQKQFDQVIRVMSDLVNHYSDDPLIERACFELAWAYKSKGDAASAKHWFQRIIDQYPNHPLAAESFFHVGQSDFENARFDSAVKAYMVAATKSASPELQEQSLYKLGLALYQQQDYTEAAKQFAKQIKAFPHGSFQIDARLMIAECSFKLENYSAAWPQYEQARKALESQPDSKVISDQVRAVMYLHGAQTARELKKWAEVDAWAGRLQELMPDSNLKRIAKYEQAFARQNQKKVDEAIRLFDEIAESERNALGARARFMIGEAYFADRNFAKAITEFQKTMYGFNSSQETEEVKNWQARAAFEAGRCSELFIGDLTGERRKKAIDTAVKFYEYILDNHAGHEMAEQAKIRINELKK